MRTFVETERLVLRRLVEADADDLCDLDGDPEVMRFLGDGRPKSRGAVEAETLPKMVRSYGRLDPFGYWAAVERPTGEFLGWFVLHPSETADASEVELGYRLKRSAWGRGYATEGSRALIREAFAEPHVRRVFAQTMAVNVASRRVMEKAGLAHVRTFHEQWAHPIEGSERGEVEYEITRVEWERGAQRQVAEREPVDARESWNRAFARLDERSDGGDAWLERWRPLLEANRHAPALDLGCGTGRDTDFLLRLGFDVVAADFSERALEITHRRAPRAKTRNVDLTHALPFADAGFGTVVASLSLHYFPWRLTLGVLQEVRRCLIPGGCLFVRVNSIRDIRYAAAKKQEIEPNFYLINGRPQRLFDRDDVLALFATGWDSSEPIELTTRYEDLRKTLWEAAARKTDGKRRPRSGRAS